MTQVKVSVKIWHTLKSTPCYGVRLTFLEAMSSSSFDVNIIYLTLTALKEEGGEAIIALSLYAASVNSMMLKFNIHSYFMPTSRYMQKIYNINMNLIYSLKNHKSVNSQFLLCNRLRIISNILFCSDQPKILREKRRRTFWQFFNF